MESEGRGRPLSIDGLDALAIAAICGVTCKPVNLKFILLLIHCLMKINAQSTVRYLTASERYRIVQLMVSEN